MYIQNSILKKSEQAMTHYRAVNYDPTRTTALRNEFVKDMDRRFNLIKALIRKAIVDDDVFGLVERPTTFETPGNKVFQYLTKEEKVSAFMDWLKEQEDKNLLTITQIPQIGTSRGEPWTNLYIQDSYKRGVIRARYELDRVMKGIPSIADTGGISVSMMNPFHADRVGMLYTRAFGELKNISSTMDNQLSKILSQGLIDGDGPAQMARNLIKTIEGGGETLGLTDKLGRFIPAQRRAQMLARTEVIRSHHQAMIQEYKNWGLEGVAVKAEWVTGEDSRVCEECKSMEGKVFTLDEIENMIPKHPGCRCISIPYVDESTKTTTEKVEIVKEVKAEIKESDFNKYSSKEYSDVNKNLTKQRKFDRVTSDISNSEFIRLAGGITENGLNISQVDSAFFGDSNGGNVEILLRTNKYFSKVEVSKYRSKVLTISHIDIPAEYQGQKIGSKLFYNILNSSKNANFNSIQLTAARAEGYNGYYTWARYGFEINPTYEAESVRFIELVQKSNVKEIKESKSLQELMSTDKGRKYWKENGFQFHGVFDINKNYSNFIDYFAKNV